MKTRKPQFQLPAFLVLALALATTAAAATTPTQPQETGWSIRFYAASVDFDSVDGYRGGSRPDYDLDIGFGLGFNAEYRFSRRLGIDLGVLGGAAVDVAWNALRADEWGWTSYDTLTFTPLTAGLDIHLTPDSSVDLFVCPMLAWIHYGGIVIQSAGHWSTTTVDFEEDLGLGLTLGLGVPMGARDRWSFAASLTHLESQLDSDTWSGGRLVGDYDATILGLGVGYRF